MHDYEQWDLVLGYLVNQSSVSWSDGWMDGWMDGYIIQQVICRVFLIVTEVA